MNQAANGVRNVVGGAENTIEGAAQGISNMTKDATNNIEKGMNKTANDISNAMNNNDRNYNATRTSTEAGTETTFMGITSTAWTWIIVGIAVVAILALVWFFSTQKNNTHYDD